MTVLASQCGPGELPELSGPGWIILRSRSLPQVLSVPAPAHAALRCFTPLRGVPRAALSPP